MKGTRAHRLLLAGIWVIACGSEEATDECTPTNGGVEICDGIDNDCNGLIDDDPVDVVMWFADGDGDGFGVDTVGISACEAPSSAFVASADDCDDSDPAVNPTADEICNGRDDDCDAEVDELCNVDGDDACAEGMVVVGAPPVCPGGGGDCDDTRADVGPHHAEWCDAVDHDCSGDSGRLVGAEVTTLAPLDSYAGNVRAAFDGEHLGIVWSERRDLAPVARFALTSYAGTLRAGPIDLSRSHTSSTLVGVTWEDTTRHFVVALIEDDPESLQRRLRLVPVDALGAPGPAVDLGAVADDTSLEILPASPGRVAVFVDRDVASETVPHVLIYDLAAETEVASRRLPPEILLRAMTVARSGGRIELLWADYDNNATPRRGYAYAALAATDGAVVVAPTRWTIGDLEISAPRIVEKGSGSAVVFRRSGSEELAAIGLSGGSPSGTPRMIASDSWSSPFYVTPSGDGVALLYRGPESYVLRVLDSAWFATTTAETGRSYFAMYGAVPAFFLDEGIYGDLWLAVTGDGPGSFPEVLQLNPRSSPVVRESVPVYPERVVSPYRDWPAMTIELADEDRLLVLQTHPADSERWQSYEVGPGGATAPVEVPPPPSCLRVVRAADGSLLCVGLRSTHGESCLLEDPTNPLTYMLEISTLAPGGGAWTSADLDEILGVSNSAVGFCSPPELIFFTPTDDGYLFVTQRNGALMTGPEAYLEVHRWDGVELVTESLVAPPTTFLYGRAAPGAGSVWLAYHRATDTARAVSVVAVDLQSGVPIDAPVDLAIEDATGATNEVSAVAWVEDRLQVVVRTYPKEGPAITELFFVGRDGGLAWDGPFELPRTAGSGKVLTGGRPGWRWVAESTRFGLALVLVGEDGELSPQGVVGPATPARPRACIDADEGPWWLMESSGLFGLMSVCDG